MRIGATGTVETFDVPKADPALARGIAIDLAFLPSIWPETSPKLETQTRTTFWINRATGYTRR